MSFIEVSEVARVGVKVARDALVASASKTLEVSLLSEAASMHCVELLLFDGSYESFLGPILVFWGELHRAGPRLAEKASKLWKERLRLLDSLYSRARIAFISKSSGKVNLVERGGVEVRLGDRGIQVPDFIVVGRVLLGLNSPRPGFLWYRSPHVKLGRACDEVRNVAPRLSCWYALTYVLLHPAGKVYQLTVPGRLEKDEVAELVRQLKHVSPDGYPYPLSAAHHLSRLGRDEFRELVALVAPELETGREQLEQTIKP